jgi:hypothetical protein
MAAAILCVEENLKREYVFFENKKRVSKGGTLWWGLGRSLKKKQISEALTKANSSQNHAVLFIRRLAARQSLVL